MTSGNTAVRKHTAMARNCMAALHVDRNIWHLSFLSHSSYKTTTLSSLRPSCHPPWSRNLVAHSTTDEEPGCFWLAVFVYSPMGLHFHRIGPLLTYWPATTYQHYPYQPSQVLWSHCTCWQVHGTTVSPQGQFGPSPNRLELSIWPTASHLVADGQVWPCTSQPPIIGHRTVVGKILKIDTGHKKLAWHFI